MNNYMERRRLGLFVVGVAAGLTCYGCGGNQSDDSDGPCATDAGCINGARKDRGVTQQRDSKALTDSKGNACGCDDRLDCTEDSCGTDGGCTHKPKPGFCVINSVCYADQQAHPASPCVMCDWRRSTTGWTFASAGPCDDGNLCTKDDECVMGICRGKYYGSDCSDGVVCTEDVCDGKGGCNHLPKSDWCVIGGKCVYKETKDLTGACQECAPALNPTQWTAITGGCTIAGVCYKSGDMDNSGCQVCDPTKSKTNWSTVTGGCTIDGVCYKRGDTDASGCKECNPDKDTKAWSDKASDCQISGKCYATGDMDLTGCGVCTPTKSKTSWSIITDRCLIKDVCYYKGDYDVDGCGMCLPSGSASAWTPVVNSCKISGFCFPKGTLGPTGCEICDPSQNASGWTAIAGCS